MLSLLSTPTAAQSPSTISSGIFAQLSSTSNVHSPLPSITVIGSLPIWIAGIVSASPAASKSAQLAKLFWIEEGARGCGRASSRECGRPDLSTPREQFGETRGRVIGDPGEHVGEPGLRGDVVELGAFDQRVDRGGALSTAVRRGLIMPGIW